MYRYLENVRKEAAGVKDAAKVAGAAVAGGVGYKALEKLLSNTINKADYMADELVIKPVVGGTQKVIGTGAKIALGAIPLSALAGAYLAATIASPKAQSEIAEDAVINAVERESLATSMRDLEELRRINALDSNKLRIHDQFI